jgi:hypothetical protein
MTVVNKASIASGNTLGGFFASEPGSILTVSLTRGLGGQPGMYDQCLKCYRCFQHQCRRKIGRARFDGKSP